VEVDGYDPFWAVTKHKDILEISRQNDLFHSGDNGTVLRPRAAEDMVRSMRGGSPNLLRTLVHMDAPDHLKYRRITLIGLHRRSCRRWRPHSRDCTRSRGAHGLAWE